MKSALLQSLFFSRKPAHLILHVTNRCNLRCRTCFRADRDDNDELSLQEIDEIASYFDKLLWLEISGGEPFVREDLIDILLRFNAKSISIATNGYDPEAIYDTVKRLRDTSRAIINIAVSLDGFQSTNDDIRGPGTFQRALKTLKMLKKLEGVIVSANTVLSQRNLDELFPFMEFIRGTMVDFHSIILLRGTPRDSTLTRPSYQELLGLKNGIFHYWNSYSYGVNFLERRILNRYQRIAYETTIRIIREKKQIPKCLAWRAHAVVYANGDVAFCEMLDPFGNLRKQPLGSLFVSRRALAQKRNIQDGNCSCYHNCNMMDNYFLNMFQYPKLLRR